MSTDAPSTLQQLKELGDRLVDIHGQHEHQSLLRPAAQRTLLDAFGGTPRARAGGASRLAQVAGAAPPAAGVGKECASGRAEREQLQWQVQELTRLAFSEQEWAELQADHGRLAHAASLIEAVEHAMEALSESEGAALATHQWRHLALQRGAGL